jgi:hypothetical protein
MSTTTNEHEIKIETIGLAYHLNGYRCSCGEGIAAITIKKAREMHDYQLQQTKSNDNK